MAIAGGTLPCVRVELVNGKVKVGVSQRAMNEVITSDPVKAAEILRAGGWTYLELAGHNRMLLEFIINNNLVPQGGA